MDRRKIVIYSVIAASFVSLLFYKVPAPEEKYTAQILSGIAKKNILIAFKDNFPGEARKALLARHSLSEVSEIKSIGIKIVEVPAFAVPEKALEKILKNENSNIEFAELDEIVLPAIIPNDPWYVNWQKNKQIINAPAAWDSTQGSENIVAAVLDTGVDCSHEDLLANCVSGWNFYENNNDARDVAGHGTKVAGIISAKGNNSVGVAGSVWNSKIIPLRISDSFGYTTWSAIANAAVYAADHGAKIVNASYQVSGSRTIERAANYVRKKGGLMVVSAGNSGVFDGSGASNLIVVSATDADDNRYGWSNFGTSIDISAPGCTGATTAKGGGYESFCGTSMSAPEAAGILMLIFSANNSLTPDQAEDILFSSAKDLGALGWDEYYGWGRVDADAAVTSALSYPINSASPTQPKGKGR